MISLKHSVALSEAHAFSTRSIDTSGHARKFVCSAVYCNNENPMYTF